MARPKDKDDVTWPIVCESLKEDYPALLEVIHERGRQNAKWGVQNHDPFTWLAVLQKEVGEFAKEALTLRFADLGDDQINTVMTDMRKECTQVAAVALAMLECLERGQWNWPEPV